MYTWAKLGPPIIPDALCTRIARAIGFLPVCIYGVWGSLLTHKVPVHMVIGKPIELPKVDDPSQEQLDMYLQQFIDAMIKLFEEHKTRTGHADLKLDVL